MLNRTDIMFIKHFENASEIFGNVVDIKGGVNYFLINKDYNGLCNFNNLMIKLNKYDIFIKDIKYYPVIDKLIKYKSINKLYLGRYFGIETNDKRLVSNKINDNYIKCFVSQKNINMNMYINKFLIKNSFNFFKVITPTASYKNNSGFGNIFIGKKDEVHSGSYVSFKLNNKKEAKSLLSYLKCILPNFMLSLRKTTIIINKETLKWIPMPPLDRIWTNEKVYKYFGLKPNEIKIIEEKNLKGFHNI
jgi:site-specific DNA-methyltransferase (adenine-specific)